MELPGRGERSLARTFYSHLCLEREHVGIFLRAPFHFLFVVVVAFFCLFVSQRDAKASLLRLALI